MKKKPNFFTYFIRGLLIIFVVFMILSMVGLFVDKDVATVLSYVKIVGGILGVFLTAIISAVLSHKK